MYDITGNKRIINFWLRGTDDHDLYWELTGKRSRSYAAGRKWPAAYKSCGMQGGKLTQMKNIIQIVFCIVAERKHKLQKYTLRAYPHCAVLFSCIYSKMEQVWIEKLKSKYRLPALWGEEREIVKILKVLSKALLSASICWNNPETHCNYSDTVIY